ncbi:glycine zipper 2TM domain-containing protein [Parasphingorhabdus halotolerans]|uniref:17 kDa surface antigen n=1 Tax=Parasphingorhabdus halotolerans TaxID=2725558 RepID=A0A6H2DK70_9SPHN|nr:glycine zipper 2TM domain-containing protein [Parasphingorhabdus halotolerans]QJB69072.1 glycine zipper 2TM domain-containing protein [Parasphingorhabdus halotolerans]
MRNILMSLAAASLVVPTATAFADPPNHAKAHGYYKVKNKHKNRYDDRGRYYEPQALRRDDRIWRGNDGRYHCKRDNGTTGLIIGGAVGALLGRELDGGRDRTVGTLLGAAGGALLGREIDRGGLKCR